MNGLIYMINLILCRGIEIKYQKVYLYNSEKTWNKIMHLVKYSYSDPCFTYVFSV